MPRNANVRGKRPSPPVKQGNDDYMFDRTLREKSEALNRIVSGMESVAVAFSGGADSALLLATCRETLGNEVLAVTASSSLYPRSFIERASRVCRSMGVEHVIIESNELKDPGFVANPPERCYLCKRELYGEIARIARGRGLRFVVDGTQADDVADYRPGMRAAEELGIKSPLLEAGLEKREIRILARKLDLETWDVPAGPCLASRVPYGQPIIPEKLEAIEKAETFLEDLGFRDLRVRYLENRTARIEVSPGQIPTLFADGVRKRVIDELKGMGFLYVTIDMEGYRTGSMNAALAGGVTG